MLVTPIDSSPQSTYQCGTMQTEAVKWRQKSLTSNRAELFSWQAAAVRSQSTGPELSFYCHLSSERGRDFPAKKKKKKPLRSDAELLCKSRRWAGWVLGSASPLRLAWLLPKGCNDSLQTTLTPWTDRCVCACVRVCNSLSAFPIPSAVSAALAPPFICLG